MTPQRFGRLVIEEGYRGRRAMALRHPGESSRLDFEAAGCYDLTVADKAKQAVDRLAVELARTDGAKAVFEELRGTGAEGSVMNYVGGRFHARPYVDVYALLERAVHCTELNDATRAAAVDAQTAVDALVITSFGMDGLTGFEPGKHGLFIVFPDGDARGERFGARVWSELAWYTPLEPAGDFGHYGRWAFLADGATPGNGKVENWFELLDSWFDDTTKVPGGLNRYRW
jgi:clostripain